MTLWAWSCPCGATGSGEDQPAAYVAGFEHSVEAHPFDESAISVTLAAS